MSPRELKAARARIERRAMRDALRAMGREGSRAGDLVRLGVAKEGQAKAATRGLRR